MRSIHEHPLQIHANENIFVKNKLIMFIIITVLEAVKTQRNYTLSILITFFNTMI